MQFLTVATAALFVAVTNAASAHVYNKCDMDVYLWSVSADKSSDTITISPNSAYSETYQIPSVGGVSLKLNTNDTCATPAPISQFEYTVAGGDIWADMSNVNCADKDCPFAPYGWYLDMGSADCPTRSCAAGADVCTGAYNAYNDDQNTLACSEDDDISLYLCTSEPPSKRAVNVERAPELAAAPHRHHRHHIRHPHVRR